MMEPSGEADTKSNAGQAGEDSGAAETPEPNPSVESTPDESPNTRRRGKRAARARRGDADAAAPAAPKRPPELTHRQRLASLGYGALWLVGLRAVLLIVAGVLTSSPLLQPLGGALLVDIAAGRAGIAWTVLPDEGASSRRLIARRSFAAAGFLASIALATIILSHGLGWASLHPGKFDSMIVLSMLAVTAGAIRDEVFLRAFPLHFASRAGLPKRAAVVFAALLSPTAFLLTGASAANVTLSLTTGLLFATIYAELGGAWPAIAAHAAWSLTIGPLVHGSALEVSWTRGELAAETSAAGPPAYVASALALVGALVFVPKWAARLRATQAAPSGTPRPG
ncbi:MAG: hypothetical protein U0271_12100 [Polyangiaceae bacterium]